MTRPALVLVPGLVCDAAFWQPVLPALSAVADCQVMDHGALDSLPAMAAALLAQAPPRFALAGHSMGGRVALEVMRQAPGRVSRLALLDTGHQPLAAGEAGAAEAAGRHALLAVARSDGMRAMGARWVQGMVHPQRLGDTRLLGDILAMIERKTPAIFAAQIRALLGRPDAGAVLAAIACPTLVACGREDSWSPPARHEEMAALVAGSRLRCFETCGHMCAMEQPQAVAEALLDWMA